MLDCTCEACVNACKRTPGLLKPGDADKIAEFLGITFEELVNNYLVIDYYFDPDVDYLAPVKLGVTAPGKWVTFMSAFFPGKCIFLDDDDRCSIHPVKPYECKMAMACEGGDGSKCEAVSMWNTEEGLSEMKRVEACVKGTKEEESDASMADQFLGHLREEK